MTIFIKHPHEQGISYFAHWAFAIGIALRLLSSVMAFAVHALLPFITIERRLDLEATAAFLEERNRFIEAAARDGWRADKKRSSVAWIQPQGRGAGG